MKKVTFEIKIIKNDNKITTRPWTGYQSETPGLVVNRNWNSDDTPGDRWNITHLKSGLAVGPSRDKRADALEIANRLSTLTDWTQTGEEVLKIDGLFHKYNQIVEDWKNGVEFIAPDEIDVSVKLAEYGYSMF